MSLITFIVPTINRPTLDNTIQSLLNQTNPNWKCFVLYDGVDGKEFTDPRIETFKLEKLGKKGIIKLLKKYKMPMLRFGKPEDLFGVIDLLISNKSSYITGQDFIIDGGWLSKGF